MNKRNISSRVCSFILVLLLVVGVIPFSATINEASAAVDNSNVQREGSAALIRNGGYRPYLEWNSWSTYGLLRHQTIYVYAEEGETLMFGSSVDSGCLNSSALTNATIGVIMPNEDGNMNEDVETVASAAYGTANYDFTNGYDRNSLYLYKAGGSKVDSMGYIANTKTEAIGPKYTYGNATYNEGGYTPLSITVPKGCGGWWTFRFFSTKNDTTNPSPVTTTSTWDQKGAYVAAWDVTVEKTSGQLASGRLCARNMFLNIGNYFQNSTSKILTSNMYALTTDGFLYNFDFNGMDPYGFVFFANNRGLLNVTDVNGETHYQSLMHSVISKNNYLDDLPGMGYSANLVPETEDDETYLLFFNEPDSCALKSITGKDHLTDDDDLKSQSFKVTFTGNLEENVTAPEPYYATEGMGGVFNITSPNKSIATSYTVIINFTGDPLLMDTYGYSADTENKIELSNSIKAGEDSQVVWDGRDAFGNVVPASNDLYENDIEDITIIAKSGEVHFPLFDVENNKFGVKVQLMNENLTNIYATPNTLHYNNDNSSLKYGSKTFADNKDMSEGIDTSVTPASVYGKLSGDQTALDFWAYYEVETTVVNTIDVHIIPRQNETNTGKNAKLPDGTYHSSGAFVPDGTVLTYEYSIKNDSEANITYHNTSYIDSTLGVTLTPDEIKLYDDSIRNIVPIDITEVYAYSEKITYDEDGNESYTKISEPHYFTSEKELKNFLENGSIDANGNYTDIEKDTRVVIGGFKRVVTADEIPFTSVVTTTIYYTDGENNEITVNENAMHSVASSPVVTEKHFVIDYSKPVTYQAKDVFDGAGEAVCNEAYAKRVKVEVLNNRGSYGVMSVNKEDFSITYKLDKIMNGSDTFEIKVTYRYASGDAASYIKKITMIPATTVYYEDDFVSDKNTDISAGFVYSGSSWTTVGTKSDYQTQRPDLNGDDHYGHDDSYDYDSLYSNGTSHYTATASVTGNLVTSTFTFKGTGFEVYSRTDSYTGIVRVIVYRGAKASGVAINYSLIDTLYKNGDLYQIPVVSLMDLDYGVYTVQLQVRSAPEFVAGTGNRTSFYIDGLKVYYPIGVNGECDTNPDFDVYGEGVYEEDNENDSRIVSIRSTVLDVNRATDIAHNNGSISEAYGAVYIDWGEYSSDDGKAYGQNTTVLSDYKNYGPKNEVYLLPGQAVAFKVGSNYNYSGTQIGAKSVEGSAASFSINNKDSFTLQTATDMYYGVTPDENGVIVIKNTSSPTAEEVAENPDIGIISLTKLKITGFSPITEDTSLVSVDRDTIFAAQSCMMTFAPREILTTWDSETVQPEETATLTVVTSNDVSTLSIDGEEADCEKMSNGTKVWTYETSYDEPGSYAVDLEAEDARGIESKELKSTAIIVETVPEETTLPTTEETTIVETTSADETTETAITEQTTVVETTSADETTESETATTDVTEATEPSVEEDNNSGSTSSLSVFLRIFNTIRNFFESLSKLFK